MKKLLIIAIFFTSFALQGQELFQYIPDSGIYERAVYVSGNALANSGALTTEFINTWINSDFISGKIKNECLKKTGSTNHAGVNLSAKAYYMRDHFNTVSNAGSIGYFAGFESNYLLSVRFTDDLFKLAFYGNKSFENDSAILDKTRFYSLAWYQAGGGIYKRVSNESGIAMGGIGLNFVAGQQLNTINVSNAQLFTADDGNYLDVKAKFSSRQSDTSSQGFGNFDGYGASTALFYKFKTRKDFSYYFSVKNLGFIRWNKGSLNLDHDTSFRFEGIQINQIINSGNLRWNAGETDSIINSYIPSYVSESYVTPLPCTAEIGLSWVTVKNLLAFDFNVNYIFFIPYKPKFQLTANLKLNKNIEICPVFSYGGFSKGNAGLEFNFTPGKYFTLAGGSEDINGIINPRRSSGISAYLALLIAIDK